MIKGSGEVVLNLWVEAPRSSNDPFVGVEYQISCKSDIHIMIHYHTAAKLQNEVAIKIILCLGITTM